MTTTMLRKRIGASVAAAAIVSSPLGLILAGPAVAQTGQAHPHAAVRASVDNELRGDMAAANPYGINKDTGSLKIVKKLNPTDYGKPTSKDEDVTTSTGELINGVKFRVTKITGDIKDQADFYRLSKMSVAEAANSLDAETAKEVVTATDGSVSLSDLPVGAYYVEEIDASAATKVSDGTKVEGVVMAEPFIAFVPMTVDSGKTWNYDVVAVPKNSSSTVTKTVSDADKNAGDEVEYTITSNVPQFNSTKSKVRTFSLVDTPDARFDLEKMNVAQVTVGGAPLTVDTDYTVTKTGGNITIALSEAKAKTLSPNDVVEAKITGILPELGTGDGTVENEVKITGSFDNGIDFETPKSEVVTKMLKLKVHKFHGDNVSLPGAEFELYRCAPNESGTLENKGDSIGGKKTTGPEGDILWDGIQVTDFENNAAVDDGEKLCLYETKAPEGYEKLTEPIIIDFGTKDTISGTGEEITLTSKVENVPENVTKLPATGEAGVWMMVLLGGGTAAVAALIIARRYHENGKLS